MSVHERRAESAPPEPANSLPDVDGRVYPCWGLDRCLIGRMCETLAALSGSHGVSFDAGDMDEVSHVHSVCIDASHRAQTCPNGSQTR